MKAAVLPLKQTAGLLEMAEGCMALLELYLAHEELRHALRKLAARYLPAQMQRTDTFMQLSEWSAVDRALEQGSDITEPLDSLGKVLSVRGEEWKKEEAYREALRALMHLWGLEGRSQEWELSWVLLMHLNMMRDAGYLDTSMAMEAARWWLGLPTEVTATADPLDVMLLGAGQVARSSAPKFREGFRRPVPIESFPSRTSTSDLPWGDSPERSPRRRE